MSSRARVYALVAAAAAAAAGIAVAVAWTGRGVEAPAEMASGPRPGAPPLVLDVLVEDEDEAARLQEGVQLYEAGSRGEARLIFEEVQREDPETLYGAVGAAVSRWPEGALAGLQALDLEHPGSALVKLHLGLVLFWLGRDEEAFEAWREAERLDPDTPAAVRAESLLHPEMPAGRPFFVAGEAPPQEIADLAPLQQLAALELRAREREDAAAWLVYGAALQRAGRPVSAAEAFDRAAELEPASVEARTAAALVRFDKDDPSQAFSRLGPLSSEYPDAPVVRFHLGLALLWLGDVNEAVEHLEAARARGAPGAVWGREAARLLARLSEAGVGGAATDANK